MSKASRSDLDASSFNGTDSSSLEPGEPASKHDKLVQDYVKLRSKLTVLKKAYVEQTELSAKKDQTIRKFELEIEALAFRNQQLTARVLSLQQELDGRAAASPIEPAQPSAQLLAEELQQKIEQNQSLHRQLGELEVDLRHKIAKGQQSLKQVEYEKMLVDKRLQALELSSKTSIEALQNDKMKLELSVIQLEDQLRATHLEKEQLMHKESEHNLVAAAQPAQPSMVNHTHHTNLQKHFDVDD
ncbi:phosphatase 1 regulatory subunit 21-like [Brachionus plicatilis]|uniref:Phosphatase 1 regulatory subunit 21-like n=1 Tax=Brachionus plicatilis TaxID=10195 RepID=A0A3M7PL81_BRAPC|nr:phosphatase 1 regulatory subunit 21-like [Brachionus plicatilis]